MSRPNKCIKDENGNEQWISRSTVVIPVVFKLDEKTGEIFTLVEQRGKAVSHTGEWCCPCGFIDWDETLEEACQREVREETGLELDLKSIVFVDIVSDPKTSNQTIDTWYMCWADKESDFDKSKIETVDEIFDVRWLKVGKVYRSGLFKRRISIDIYNKSIEKCFGTWAFKTHPGKIIEMLKMVIKGGKVYETNE